MRLNGRCVTAQFVCSSALFSKTTSEQDLRIIIKRLSNKVVKHSSVLSGLKTPIEDTTLLGQDTGDLFELVNLRAAEKVKKMNIQTAWHMRSKNFVHLQSCWNKPISNGTTRHFQ